MRFSIRLLSAEKKKPCRKAWQNDRRYAALYPAFRLNFDFGVRSYSIFSLPQAPLTVRALLILSDCYKKSSRYFVKAEKV